MQALVPIIVQVSLILLVAAVGMQSRWNDLSYVLARPALLLRGFVAVNLVVPAAAVLLCLLLPVAPMTKVGLILMAVSPLAPFLPGKMLKAGADVSYVVGLYVALILVAILVVPITVAILDALFPADATVPLSAIAMFVVQSVLLPIGAGVAIGSLWPRFGRRAAPIVTIIAYVLLLPVVVLLLVKSGSALAHLVGDGSLLVIILTVAAGLAAGHGLGGPVPEHRIALAQAATTRNPGIAGLIANANFDSPQVMLAVLLFLLTSLVVGTIYTLWALKRLAPAQAPKTA